jgi:hypothetical protein
LRCTAKKLRCSAKSCKIQSVYLESLLTWPTGEGFYMGSQSALENFTPGCRPSAKRASSGAA